MTTAIEVTINISQAQALLKKLAALVSDETFGGATALIGELLQARTMESATPTFTSLAIPARNGRWPMPCLIAV